ncbi:unnamed protein product [Calypogeia fissa]
MAEEQLVDVIIFGASGFTGKYVIRELLKFTDCPKANGGDGKRKVGIAGRNKSKLSASLTWALEGKPSPVQVSIFEANVDDPASLASLVKKTRLMLNVVGPYRKYGEPVVKACVEAGVDYLDITGEPEFMERMEAVYHEPATKAGSLVVSACGYDSIPAELGVIHNARQFGPPTLPQSCDSYLELSNKLGRIHGNIGTWESAVLGVAHETDLQKLRKSRPRRSRPQIPGLLTNKPAVHYEPNSRTWAVKLPSADAIVVRRTFAARIDNPEGLPTVEDETNPDFTERKKQKWESIKPVQFGVYVCNKTIAGVVGFFLLGVVLVIFAQFKWGRSLLVKYPEIFSFGTFLKQGPTEENVRNSSFQQWFVGKGFSDSSKFTKNSKPDKQIVTRISGPEIGYITTPICLVQAALIVLDQRSSLPKGGVLTPGTVFGTTDLQERMEKNGVHFDVVSTSQI